MRFIYKIPNVTITTKINKLKMTRQSQQIALSLNEINEPQAMMGPIMFNYTQSPKKKTTK